MAGLSIPTQLGLSDLEEIASFLQRVWATQYRGGSHPEFSPEYLRWLYGGPYADENVLIGVRANHGLVGYRALLSRPLLLGGRAKHAYLSTHLTIDRLLGGEDRNMLREELTTPYTFTGTLPGRNLRSTGACDVLISFFEEGSRIPQSLNARFAALGASRSFFPFQHAVVNPDVNARALRRRPAPEAQVRAASRSDAPVLAALARRLLSSETLAVSLTPEWIEHHMFGLARSAVYLMERPDGPVGFISVYLLSTVSGHAIRRVVIVEFLVVDDSPDSAVLLIAKALEFARLHGARGVVMENTTFLNPESLRQAGMIASTRRMVFSIASREGPYDLRQGFAIDVK